MNDRKIIAGDNAGVVHVWDVRKVTQINLFSPYYPSIEFKANMAMYPESLLQPHSAESGFNFNFIFFFQVPYIHFGVSMGIEVPPHQKEQPIYS